MSKGGSSTSWWSRRKVTARSTTGAALPDSALLQQLEQLEAAGATGIVCGGSAPLPPATFDQILATTKADRGIAPTS